MGLRQEKVARQIQKDLGELMQQHRGEWMAGAFVTIAKVTITPDLGYVNVYLSLYNNANRVAVLDHISIRIKKSEKHWHNAFDIILGKYPRFVFTKTIPWIMLRKWMSFLRRSMRKTTTARQIRECFSVYSA